MPRALVFAPTIIGGIGLLDLYTEQGCCKIIIIISHIRAKTPLCNTIIIALETYQTVAGITTPALETTNTISYVDAPWITTTRDFLKQIKGKIHIPELATIVKIRQHDIAIMSSCHTFTFTK
jgi:hypothetical protein